MNKKIVTTLCIVHQHPRILLGMKKRGFGKGRWNGFGGKVLAGETIESAAKREMLEEAGIKIKNLEKVGIINFEFEDGTRGFEVHFFKTDDFEGEPRESEEMKPAWFYIDEIPFSRMWPDDTHWMPLFLFLRGRKFRGKFLFDKPPTSELMSTILEKELEEVEEI